MQKPSVATVLRFAAIAVVVAAIISGYPQRLFHRAEPLRAADQRPRMTQFTLPGIANGDFSLAAEKGNVVVVNFWATWCPPCRAETPDLVRFYDRYRSRGVSVVGINMDDDPQATVPSFVRQYRMEYPVVVPDENFGLATQVESLPTTLLIDRNGRVAKSYIGQVHTDELEADVQQLLAESANGA